MKKIFICGAGGYLGTRLVPYLLKNKYEVTACDRYYFGDVFNQMPHPRLRVVKSDIRTISYKDLKGYDAVINLAAISNDPASELNPVITQEINYKGAVSLAKQAKRAGISRLVFASSCSVYGHSDIWLDETSELAPVSEYARSKIAAEKELLQLNDDSFGIVVLRMGTLHGLSPLRMRFDLIVNIMTLHAWKNNRIIIMGGGRQWRPLLHVDDAARAYELALVSKHKDVSGEIFNVGSNEENYQVTPVAHLFRNYFPAVVIEKAPDDADKRNYRVRFDKIATKLGYKTKYSLGKSIEEIKRALDEGLITDDIKTKTVQYYQYLIDADKVLESIKIHNQLF